MSRLAGRARPSRRDHRSSWSKHQLLAGNLGDGPGVALDLPKTVIGLGIVVHVVERSWGKGGNELVADRLSPARRRHARVPKVRSLVRKHERFRVDARSSRITSSPGKVTAANAAKLTSAKTVNGQTIKIAAKDGVVTINDAKVIQADIETTNGVIHVIDKVILPK